MIHQRQCDIFGRIIASAIFRVRVILPQIAVGKRNAEPWEEQQSDKQTKKLLFLIKAEILIYL